MKRFCIYILISGLLVFKAQAFRLISNDGVDLIVDGSEQTVVHTAIEIFRSDFLAVSEHNLRVTNELTQHAIVVGSLGQNPVLDGLIESGAVSVEKIKGQWEAFQIQVVRYLQKDLLIVAGSDSRGTAYGVMELSRLIGVSPWEWWADCRPEKKTTLTLPDDYVNIQQPSVQYRGIFINDEGSGFTPWSVNVYDPVKDKLSVGPKTYAKVFELLLRLRANTIWPAMHPITKPFYYVEGNREIAQKYGIVVGTSHHEPLMRNTSEWDKKKWGAFNYTTNRRNILNFWEERLKELSKSENYYTMGIRGAGDVEMEGAKTVREQVDVLNQVFADQRSLLKQYINEDLSTIPQVFVPYKEVLELYDQGLVIPEDISLMWCDDNYGYITKFTNEEERQRMGGTGIYYHVSYWGRPHEYTWISTTPPAFMYWQMKKAYDSGAKKIWIVNVGDIKPAELDMELFLNLAWDIDFTDEQKIEDVHADRLKLEFGDSAGEKINHIMKEYYRLAFVRKPELIGWSRIEEDGFPYRLTPIKDTEFKLNAFGDQVQERIDDYKAIMLEVQNMYNALPDNRKDAFYQMVYFPVHASGEMNLKWLYAQKSRYYASFQLPVANEYGALSLEAHRAVDSLVHFYNTKMSQGKWNKMMHTTAWRLPLYGNPVLPEKVSNTSPEDLVIWVENQDNPVKKNETIQLTPFVVPGGQTTFISIATTNGKRPNWEIRKKPKWVEVAEKDLNVESENRIIFTVLPEQLKSKQKGTIEMRVNNDLYKIEVEAKKVKTNIPIEHNQLIVADVKKYIQSNNAIKPTVYPGLGYSLHAVELVPGQANAVSYPFYSHSKGDAQLTVRLLPNHPINSEDIRYAVKIDQETPQIVSFKSDFINRDLEWKDNVSRNQAVKTTTHSIRKAGKHTVTIYALDEGVVLDQLSLDFDQNRTIYELPSMKVK